jgi:Zn-dependent oligopeptidase
MLTARDSQAAAKNVPLMNEIVGLRRQIAAKLGYASWADYQTETKMVKNAATAIDFMQRLKTGLQPKLDGELRELAELKRRDTGDPRAQINLWDWRYYANQLKKEKYTVDAEALRVYFPYARTLRGMFDIYETIFGLRIVELAGGYYKWQADLKLYGVTDARTGQPLGAFYLDMFPRDGKYNHFAQFPIIPGKRLPDGRYQRPIAALICNFPPPAPGKPSLLSHEEVETLFHEFGHAMHTLLSTAELNRFSGTSVPGDFVEAPSQMLENWIWDKRVLDSFAADYREPTKKIPQAIIAQLKAAKLATIGAHYRRQLSFGLLDMALHASPRSNEPIDCVKLTNPVLSDVFLPVVEGTSFIAGFGHMAGGYDASYYGYAWADAIAQDLATEFEKAPGGFLDPDVGRRLRDEIYAPGGARDVNESIERFLGRAWSIQPFLKHLGIGDN